MPLLQRPAPELNPYLASSGITSITSIHGAPCGTYDKEQMPTYAQAVEKTVIIVTGFSGQNSEALADLIKSVYNTVKKQQQIFTAVQR